MPEYDDSVIYEFAGFSVDSVRRRLLRNGVPVSVTSKALDTLLYLIERGGETVTKAELMNAVWSDTAVEENNLTQQISTLRRIFGERPNDHRFIVTVPGRGYCFVAEVRRDAEAASMPVRSADRGRLRGYALAIAYALLVLCPMVWTAVQEDGRPQSLAVLNFRASGGEVESIQLGISETLRARLGSVEDLVVRPAPADADVLNAGRRLQVDTVVTGSVQRDHDRVRVIVEMVDVANGRIVWGKTFDDSVSNIFTLQDAIAGEVAKALRINPSSSRSSIVRRAKLYV
ncbi:MAG TPA: winged helix-turn-helix domain-containing protein [Pyrinomonadaceae bacterium]|nr:winged helix-turn-helix domain-containing protein [Pyrinomonadaceae bacterium]